MPLWTVPAPWPGETVFIVAGGPSIREQNLDLLRGRRIIAINSSYLRLPEHGLPPPHLPHLDYLLVGDNRWWKRFGDQVRNSVAFQIVTTAQRMIKDDDPQVLKVRKHHPPGLSGTRNALAMRRTTLSAAINLAAFLAPGGSAVLLGADGKFGADGTRNHHGTNPFPHRDGCWQRHHDELKTLVAPLQLLRFDVVNASPGSMWGDLWPVMSLEAALEATEKREKAA